MERNKRIQHVQDIFLHMGDKAFFDNEYAIAPASLIKGLENPYDRNGLHDMKLIREMCHRMDGLPTKDFMNPGAVDMRYAFGDGDKPGFPTPQLAESYDHLLKQQHILDFTEHNKQVQESLREIHTAGDIDLMNRSIESGNIDLSDPKILNNPLLSSIVKAIPSSGKGSALEQIAKSTASKAVKDVSGVDVGQLSNDVLNGVNNLAGALDINK